MLLSVHPEYAESILNGSKRVEFRKTPFGADPDLVVLYATSPVKRVVGYFEVDNVESMATDALWRKYRGVSGMSIDSFRDYYADSQTGVALAVGAVCSLRTPMPLPTLLGNAPPPQSFRYLPLSAAEKVLQAAC